MKSNFGRCAIFLGFKGFTIFFIFSFLLPNNKAVAFCIVGVS